MQHLFTINIFRQNMHLWHVVYSFDAIYMINIDLSLLWDFDEVTLFLVDEFVFLVIKSEFTGGPGSFVLGIGPDYDGTAGELVVWTHALSPVEDRPFSLSLRVDGVAAAPEFAKGLAFSHNSLFIHIFQLSKGSLFLRTLHHISH